MIWTRDGVRWWDLVPLKKWFAWRPVKLYNGDWVWWESVYRMVVCPKRWRTGQAHKEYYTEEEAALLRLRGGT